MDGSEHDIARRTVLMSAGLAGAGLVAGTAPARAATPAGAGEAEIWSQEYWAQKGSVKLNLWRKRASAPKAGEKPLPALFLVHGSSNSARTSFDLQVGGKDDYSVMHLMAQAGYDVWTMDHDGYGRSGDSGGSSDIASGVEDLKAAVPVVLKETGQSKLHMYGPSSGSIRAGAYAMVHPERVDRLVLAAFTYKGSGAAEIQRRRSRIEELRASPRRRRDANMIRSIFTRDGHAQGYDPAIAEAIIAEEMKFGDTIPAGTYVDMAVNLPLVDPTRVKSPVLMVRGEHDGIATEDDLLAFYRRLPNADRQFVVLAGAAHSLGLGNDRHRVWHVVRAFLDTPAGDGAADGGKR